jgi:UDP-3-O-[3-hydroxymyristoyl] glucosamine N-acyltransferase
MSSYLIGSPLKFSEITEKLSAELGVFHNGEIINKDHLEEAGISLDSEDAKIHSVSSPDTATKESCVCINDKKHFLDALESDTENFVVSESLKPFVEKTLTEKNHAETLTLFWVKDAYNSLASQYFYSPDSEFPWGDFKNSETVSDTAEIGENTLIARGVSISSGAVIGKNCKLYPGVVISQNVHIGDDAVLFPNVVIYPDVKIGDRVRIHSGVVIGADGFGYSRENNFPNKIHHVGAVVIGNDVEIGANSAIDRGTFGNTVVGNSVKIDNLCQVGHNVSIGDGTVVCGQSGLAGSGKVGKLNTLGGMTGMGPIETGTGAMFAAGSMVSSSKIADGAMVAGRPDRPYREWIKLNGYISRLPELFKKVKKLESK